MTPPHPAKFSTAILGAVAEVLAEEKFSSTARVLDPFAGVGGVHSLPHDTWGVELEWEWARAHFRTIVGDATTLPWDADTFDAIVTSPCYGNRMADHHTARDKSERNTYRHKLGRPLGDRNAGAMQWGKAYRALHLAAWQEAHRVLRPGGLVVLNISNHIRQGVEQRVAEWHLATWLDLGVTVHEVRRIRTPRLRQGANAAKRIDGELLMVLRG